MNKFLCLTLRLQFVRLYQLQPFIRTEKENGNVALSLTSLPHNVDDPKQTAEAEIISRLLNAVGDKNPKLVGFNSANADLKNTGTKGECQFSTSSKIR